MKDFWNDITTQKSWDLLLKIKKLPFEFVVIGGWAAYLWTKTHKSKDIDIVLKTFEDLKYLKEHFELKKNDNLKKYEIVVDEIDIDIYTAFYSKLTLPVEEIIKNTAKIEGIELVAPEVLLILKQGAELERKDSVKGSKDRIDIMTLLIFADIDFKKYRELLNEYKLIHFMGRIKEIISTFKDIGYLDLNPRQFKLKKEEIISKIKS